MWLLSYILVGLTILLLAAWYLRPDFRLRKQFDLFLIVWAYYTLSVPIDLFLGLEVRGSHSLPDLHHSVYDPYVVEALLHFYALFGGYLLAYVAISRQTGKALLEPVRAVWRWTQPLTLRRLPPIWLSVILPLTGVLALKLGFQSADRGDFAFRIRTDQSFFLLTLLFDFVKAVILVHIVYQNDRRRALVFVGMSIAMSLLLGSRTYAVFALIAWLMRYNVRIGIGARISLIGLAFFVLYFLKSLYLLTINCLILWSFPKGDLFSMDFLGLSGKEGVTAWSFFVHFLKEGYSDWLLGETYIYLPLVNTLPRRLTGMGDPTLAEHYMTVFNPDFLTNPHGMGFSALAEAWMNFGLFGPVLVGAVWGAVSRLVDLSGRGVFFFLFTLASMRFFRSDFASLYKSNFIVLGFFVMIVYLLFFLWDRTLPLFVMPRASKVKQKFVMGKGGSSD